MKRIKNSILFLGLALLLVGCAEENLDVHTSSYQPEPKPIITTSLYGLVVDENDVPVKNAEIALKSGAIESSIHTDDFGNFVFENIQNKGRSAYLTISAPGKFDAFRRYGVLPNQYNYTVVKMNEKGIAGRVEARDGGTITNDNGAKVKLPAGGVIDHEGNQFNGTVHVAMSWINPEANDLTERMVGDLSGIDLEGQNRALITYGMLQVELMDDSGNVLNLSAQHEAELSFPVPLSMRDQAPSQIPLWIYEEEIGTWQEVGSASLENGFYVGNVPHFSSFNVDMKVDPIEIKGQVKIDFGNGDIAEQYSCAYMEIYASSERINRVGGYLSDDGSFQFINFPKDEVFTLKILDACGEVMFEQEYGPYTENTDLGCIVLDPSPTLIRISGNALGCHGTVIEQGVFYLDFGDRRISFPIEEDGRISFATDVCSYSEAEYYVFDADQLIQSDRVSINLNSGTIDIGEVILCEDIEEYIEFGISDGLSTVLSPDVEYHQNLDSAFAMIEFKDGPYPHHQLLRLYLKTEDIPTTAATNITLESRAFLFSNNSKYNYYRNDGITIEFQEFDPSPGGKMIGSFSGLVFKIADGEEREELDIEGSFDFTVN